MVAQLDIRTLSFITVLFSVVFGLGLLCAGYYQKKMAGIRELGLGILITGFGFLLLGLRGLIPEWSSVILANCTIFGGFVMMSESTRLFMGLGPLNPRIGLVLGPVLAALFTINTYWAPSVHFRIVWISLFLALQAGLSAADIIRSKQPDLLLARAMTAIPFAVTSLFFLFRALWAFSETGLQTFMSAGTVHQLGFLVIDLLILTASFGFMWLTSARLEKELRDQARIDNLTGVFNRRAMEELSQRELARVSRHGRPLSLIMVDIDHFKRLNDNHGHQAGDMVLSKLAGILKNNLRSQDFVIRYGGEEFLLLLPDTDLDRAGLAAEKLRVYVRETGFGSQGDLKATISLGAAEFQPGEDWEQLVGRADAALYQAKEQGRDRVVKA